MLSQDQLKREIQTNVAAALKQSAITGTLGSANETCIVLSQYELNTTLEKVVDVAVEKHLATAVEEVIANTSHSFEQLVSPIMTLLRLLRVPAPPATLPPPAGRSRSSAPLLPLTSTGSWVHGHVCGKIIGYQQKTPDAFHPITIIVVSQLMTDMWMALASHTDATPGTISGLLQLLFMKLSPSTLKLSVPAPTSTTHYPSPSHPMWGVTTSVILAVKVVHKAYSYPNDPLWDGQGCGRLNTCCSFNNLPWFMKELPSPTGDDIEMRLCADESRSNEDIPVEVIELDVQ